MFTRRDFCQLLGFGATVPTFLGRTAMAAPNAKETILVVVQLTGGNDGLNTVIPFNDGDYYKYRPTIAVPKDKVIRTGSDFGLHPSFDGMARLLNDRNAVAIVQGVGYPNPSQSHFRSMDVWHAGSTAETLAEGWIGKALKAKAAPSYHLAAGNEASPLAMAGAPARVPSVTSLEDFQLKVGGINATESARQKALIEQVAKGSPMGEPGLLDFVRRTATTTYATTEKLKQVGKNYTPKVPYPAGGFANRLKLAAQLIDAGVGARIFYVSHDGFDTHAGQGGMAGSHANLLKDVGDGISAFYRDMAERGHGERVCILTFSEFGRRAKENGSAGTDHGSAAPMFLVGGKVKGGYHGTHPSLTKLDDGNLVHSLDFRRVYAGVLKDWLGIDPKPVLGDGFAPLPLFKA